MLLQLSVLWAFSSRMWEIKDVEKRGRNHSFTQCQAEEIRRCNGEGKHPSRCEHHVRAVEEERIRADAFKKGLERRTYQVSGASSSLHVVKTDNRNTIIPWQMFDGQRGTKPKGH